ncbi:MAG TPA: hypothetical protein VFX70_10405 [Mycobacteriales bacterium]|nr:hypothetical protein [Mycobacteriales bacterium]
MSRGRGSLRGDAYETKSNLRRSQIRVLLDAGLVKVRPGVETLSSRVLRIMDKG